MKLSRGAYTFIAGLIGLVAMTTVIAYGGCWAILQTLEQAGWGLLWLIPFHAAPLILDAEGWLALLRPRDPEGYATRPFLIWIAVVREAVSRLLPVASIGGEIVGIRLATLRPINGSTVAASVILEVLLTLINQCLFTAAGLALLVMIVKTSPVVDALLVGLAVSLSAPFVLAVLLLYGSPFTHVAFLAERMLGNRYGFTAMLGRAANLDEEIRQLCRRRWLLLAALAWQLAGMLVGSFETWFALELFGRPATAWDSIILESLSLAFRHVVFFLPGALGVQETALIVVGALIGLPADAAIALSLAKRFREIAIGLPALASWQWIEIRRFHRKLGGRTPFAAE